MIHLAKYPIEQHLVDEPDPELRRIFHLIRHQNRPFRKSEFTDHKSIVVYLNRNGWTARVSHADLVATVDEEVIAYRTMMKALYEAQISTGNTTALSDAT
jgi:hypothetical protein